jgi:hypothetical protein
MADNQKNELFGLHDYFCTAVLHSYLELILIILPSTGDINLCFVDNKLDAIGVVVEGDFDPDADVVVVVEDKIKIKMKIKKSLFDLRRRRLDQLMI